MGAQIQRARERVVVQRTHLRSLRLRDLGEVADAELVALPGSDGRCAHADPGGPGLMSSTEAAVTQAIARSASALADAAEPDPGAEMVAPDLIRRLVGELGNRGHLLFRRCERALRVARSREGKEKGIGATIHEIDLH